MPEAVVDDLEVVDVAEQHSERAATPQARLGEHQPIGEQGAIGQPGERVVHGLMSKLRLGPLALRNVLHLGDQIEGAPILIAHRRDAERDPDHLTVGAEIALLGHVSPSLAIDQVTEAPVGVEIVRVRDIREGHPCEVLLGVSGQVGERLVHLQPLTLRADDRHPGRAVVEGAPEPLIGLAQRAV